eukprot:m51a1_g14747 hypothetical protein (118) ;mRNA; f:311269-311747
MSEIKRLNPTRRYADATVYNGLVHATEVPASEDGDMRSQVVGVLDSLATTLVKAGSNKSRILMATIYVVDMADVPALNEAWEAWLPEGCAPARACVQVSRLACPGWRVEIALTAAAL